MTDVTDDFNRASLGTNWTNVLRGLAISSNTVVKNSTNSDSIALWNANTFDPDHFSQITVVNDVDGGGPAVRISSAASCYIFYTNNTTQCVYYEVTNGAGFVVIGSAININPSAGQTMKLSVSGSTLTANVDGADQASRNDASNTGGSVGIHIYNTTQEFDDWIGGPITGGSCAVPPTFNVGFTHIARTTRMVSY